MLLFSCFFVLSSTSETLEYIKHLSIFIQLTKTNQNVKRNRQNYLEFSKNEKRKTKEISYSEFVNSDEKQVKFIDLLKCMWYTVNGTRNFKLLKKYSFPSNFVWYEEFLNINKKQLCEDEKEREINIFFDGFIAEQNTCFVGLIYFKRMINGIDLFGQFIKLLSFFLYLRRNLFRDHNHAHKSLWMSFYMRYNERLSFT